MIIGLSGYAQSGKDEVAKILVSEYGFTRVAFADKIRELLYEMNPNFRDTLLQQAVDNYGWDEVKKDQTVRRMMQNLGVGARKLFGDNFWVAQIFNGYDWDIPTVVTDVRFQNEAYLLKKWTPDDTQIWRVKRPGVEAVNGHISEHDLDDYKFDQILKNEGTLEDLTNMVRRRMEFTLNAN
jgi:dephospho-CoA kinase